jgi:hypothetical protein
MKVQSLIETHQDRTDAKRASADRKQTKEHPNIMNQPSASPSPGWYAAPYGPPGAATPVVLTDEDLERLPYGGPHKAM